MINIKDLHFNKEILPLFDFTGNEFSRQILMDLLSAMPHSLVEVITRQETLKLLIENKIIYSFARYSTVDFNEVYNYTEDYKNRNAYLEGNALKLHLFFSKSEKSRERARLTQLIIFLYELNQSLFSHLQPALFPPTFKEKIEHINDFLSELNINRYYSIVRKKYLGNTDIARLIELLLEKNKNGKLDEFWKNVFWLEAYFSISKGIIKCGFKFPEFVDTTFAFSGFYHPLLKNPVRNSLVVTNNVTLITGPNMSGKSTLLKALGLCVLLAHLGLAIPAEKCELPFFDHISIAINLNDDLKNGFSHFMTEIKTLKTVVTEARKSGKCFAIFDELFRGTNEEDALAISTTTILGLGQFQTSYFFVSTHLQQLKHICVKNSDKISTYYIDCNLNDNKPSFTYNILPGWSDLKIGQILFQEEGLGELLAL